MGAFKVFPHVNFASYKHLNAYCNEFSYGYNTRKSTDAERFEASLVRVEGKRIKHKDLISKYREV